jgi:hypothetical protein
VVEENPLIGQNPRTGQNPLATGSIPLTTDQRPGGSTGELARRRAASRYDQRSLALRRALAACSWLAFGWLLVVYAIGPDLRPGLRDFLALGYLLVFWFFLARTKTLSWQSVAGLFSVCVPWGIGVGLFTHALTDAHGLVVADFGARTALAAVTEESLNLLPLLALVVLFPARVWRFSVTDWLLVGFGTGLSFQAVQEFTRLDGSHAHYGLSPLSGGLSVPGASFPGQHVLTALIAVTIGLSVAGWRHAGNRNLSSLGKITWRVLAVVAPLGCWWLTISVHAGYNATRLVGFGWVNAADPTMPWVLRIGWRLGQHGAGLGWLLLGLLLIALLVDAGRLRNAAEEADDPLPYPFAPTQAADQWAGRLTGWAGTRTALPIAAAVWLIATGCAAVAYAVRDLVVLLAAHNCARSLESGSSRRRESRWTAISRGRAAGVMLRSIRAEAMALASVPDTPAGRRNIRLVGVAGIAAVLLAVFWLGPHWAEGIGDALNRGGSGVVRGIDLNAAPEAWMAGTQAAVTGWWTGLEIWGYLILVLGFVAVLMLSAGPLDLPAPLQGGSVLLVARSLRLSGPPRELAVATRSYLSVSTPTEVLVDVAGALAQVLPRRLAGESTGANVRRAVREFAADPAGFIAVRRAAARLAASQVGPLAGPPARVRDTADLPPIKLADGRLLSPLSYNDEQLFLATLDELIRGNIRVRNDGADYQVRIYGDDERLIAQRPERWSDGQNIAYGMVGDTAYYDGRGASWYAPETLPESIRHKAYLELDRRLIEYATVVYYPASPFRALEITTNHPLVAHALEERMARLAIPGYVVLEP